METPEVNHTLVEKTRIASLSFKTKPDDPSSALTYRVNTILALVALCKRREFRRKRATIELQSADISRLVSVQTSVASPDPGSAPILISNTRCFFCACMTDPTTVSFDRSRIVKRHVESQHLKWFAEEDLIPCPDLYCRLSGVVLFGKAHFNNHVERTHVI